MNAPKLVRAATLAAWSLVAVSCDDAPAPTPITSHLELQDDMRALWTADATWMRAAITSSLAGLPDLDVATGRLLEGQDDIADAVRPFMGDDAADQLTLLLHEHVTLALTIARAARGGDAQALASSSSAWYANADAIAQLLSNARPITDDGALRTELRAYLDETLAGEVARLEENWELDAAAYDAMTRHALRIADMLAAAIEQSSPELVAASTIDPREQAMHLTLRALWQERATWTRFSVVSALADLPDRDVARDRALRAQVAISDAFREALGDGVANELRNLLRENASITFDFIDAYRRGDEPRLRAAVSAWGTNAEQLALFFAGSATQQRLRVLRTAFRTDVDQWMAQITARLASDWVADVIAYDVAATNILDIADLTSDGMRSGNEVTPLSQ